MAPGWLAQLGAAWLVAFQLPLPLANRMGTAVHVLPGRWKAMSVRPSAL
jgi:hypothetical protein